MKTIYIFITLMICSVSFAYCQKGGSVIRQQDCDLSKIQHQVDSVKSVYLNLGFGIVREASMTMESEYEMPVIVPFNEGTFYQIVFIGEPNISLLELRMYDYNERQVVYEKNLKNDKDANVVSFSYIPKFSEFHIIKPVQVVKRSKNSICGYILLLKKLS